MLFVNENSAISSFKNILVYWMVIQLYLTFYCHAMNRRHNHHHTQNNIRRKEISLTRKTHHNLHHHEWNGDDRTTCTFITNHHDYLDSKCIHPDNGHSTEIEKNLKELTLEPSDGLWISSMCHESCSIIYEVKNSSRIKQGIITGFVDTKGEIIIQAQYTVDVGVTYQLGNLNNHNLYDYDYSDDNSGNFTKKQFELFHQENLDISILNATIVLNQGFAVIESIKLVIEEEERPITDIVTTNHVNDKHVINQIISLDKKRDVEKDQWLDITCSYSEAFQDFWTFGCPIKINGHKNHIQKSSGFWSPCHDRTCTFLYDGTLLSQPRSVTIDGYMQGGSISLSAKSHTLDQNELRILETKSFHNSTVFQVTFDLKHFCNISVLQILVSSDSDIILIDKISVHLHSTNPKEPCKEIIKAEPVENARAIDVQDKSLNKSNANGKTNLSPLSLFMIFSATISIKLLL